MGEGLGNLNEGADAGIGLLNAFTGLLNVLVHGLELLFLVLGGWLVSSQRAPATTTQPSSEEEEETTTPTPQPSPQTVVYQDEVNHFICSTRGQPP